MISVADWINGFRARALRDKDDARLRLTDFYLLSRSLKSEHPDQKLARYEAGGNLARQLGEPWWQLFFEFWKISTLLCDKLDTSAALDLAVRAALEVAKPLYDGFPARVTLNLLLASVYAEIDPIGHEKSIRGVFDYARQCDSWIGVPPFLEQQWSHFLDVIDDAQAVASAWRFLQLADEVDSDHYRAGALLLLCKLLHYREPEIARAMLSDLATEAEVCARNKKNDRYFAMALMWRAVAARVRNDESAACELYHRAWTIQERLTTPQNVVNEGAMAYHEFAGETESSLRVCRAELRVAVEHGLIFGATVLRFKECQLLQQLNCPYAAEAQQLRLGAAQLPGRAHWEAKLGALERTA